VEDPISWADEERDLTAWLGNDLQDDAFDNLYALEELVRSSDDPEIHKDWCFLQASDHFYYMCTKWFSDGDVHKYFNPYGSPYEAYINYMNVLADLKQRLEHKSKQKESPGFSPLRKTVKASKEVRKAKPSDIADKVKNKIKEVPGKVPKKAAVKPARKRSKS
jgi:alpha-amylase